MGISVIDRIRLSPPPQNVGLMKRNKKACYAQDKKISTITADSIQLNHAKLLRLFRRTHIWQQKMSCLLIWNSSNNWESKWNPLLLLIMHLFKPLYNQTEVLSGFKEIISSLKWFKKVCRVKFDIIISIKFDWVTYCIFAKALRILS